MFKEISSTVGCEVKCNRQFPSSLVPLFESESKCETILMIVTDLHENKTACRTHFHVRGFALSYRGTRKWPILQEMVVKIPGMQARCVSLRF